MDAGDHEAAASLDPPTSTRRRLFQPTACLASLLQSDPAPRTEARVPCSRVSQPGRRGIKNGAPSVAQIRLRLCGVEDYGGHSGRSGNRPDEDKNRVQRCGLAFDSATS